MMSVLNSLSLLPSCTKNEDERSSKHNTGFGMFGPLPRITLQGLLQTTGRPVAVL